MRRPLTPAVLLPAALAIAFIALFLGHLASPSALLATRDVPIFHLPLRTVLREAATHGLPLWNPTIHGGQPILSNPNYAAFYPPTWLSLLVPVHASIGLVVLMHAGLGFFGARAFARRLGCEEGPAALAGLGFVFGGASLASISLLNHFCGLAWLPWVLLGCDRAFDDPGLRRAALPAVALALQILAGEPVIVITTGLAAAVMAVSGPGHRWRRLARLAAVCVLAVSLAGLQVLPTLLRITDTSRADGLEQRALSWSSPPARALELVWPHALGDPMRVDEELYFGWSIHDREFPFLPSIYPGQLIVLLAAAALLRWPIRYRFAWLAMLAAGAVLASGSHSSIVAWLLQTAPVLSWIRYPEKFLLLTTSGMVFAAALAWQHLLDARRRRDTPLEDFPLALASVAAAISLLLLFVLGVRPDVALWFARSRAALPPTPEIEEKVLGFFRQELGLALGVSLACVAVLALHRRRRTPKIALVGATVALLTIDLYVANHRLTPTVTAADVLQTPAFLSGRNPADGGIFTDRSLIGAPSMTLKNDRPGPALLWSQVDRADPYLATVWGFHYAIHTDFDLMATAPARRALATLLEVRADPDAFRRLLGAWSVRFLVFNRPVVELLQERAAGFGGARVRVEENPHWRPTYRLETRVALVPERRLALAAEHQTGFEGSTWIDPAQAPRRVEAAGATVLELAEKPAAVKIRYRAAQLTPLTVARTYHRGWQAFVDGDRQPVFETGLGMMGVLLPAGERTLVLRFRQPGLAAGIGWSIVAVAIIATGTVRERRRITTPPR